jgi:hypothetical protein
MVLTVSFVLSPVTGLSCHRRPQDHHLGRLDISVGISGPHDFSVRRIGALVSRTACVHRIPPHVRDDRETPLCRDGMDWLYCCFYQIEKRNFFSKKTGRDGQISAVAP